MRRPPRAVSMPRGFQGIIVWSGAPEGQTISVGDRRCGGSQRFTLLHPPDSQSSFSSCRIIFDPVDRLTSEPYGPCDLADTCGIAEHRLRTLQLLATVARLTAFISARVTFALACAIPARCASLVASAWAWAVAAMKAISASRTAHCMASLVAPSNVMPLITARITTPRYVNSRIVSQMSW
jgi:hypothetical protein